MAEAFADLETPLSLYLKLAHSKDGGKHSFLLESVVGGERFGRYSFIGLPARTLVRSKGFGADVQTEVVTDGAIMETSHANPLDFISDYQKRFKVFPWNACGRAIANVRDEGVTKLLFDDSKEAHGHGKILGGGMVGTHAGDMIGEIALAIEMGADAVDIGKTIHPHQSTPTVAVGTRSESRHELFA